MPRRPSIESVRYNSPTLSEQRQIFVIDIDKGSKLDGRQSGQDELFTKSAKAREIEAENGAKLESRLSVTSRSKSNSPHSDVLIIPGKKKKVEDGEVDVEGGGTDAAFNSGVEGQGSGAMADGGRDSLQPPIEGQVPFHRDIDELTEDACSEDDRSMTSAQELGDSGVAVDKAGVDPDKAKAAIGLFSKPAPKGPPPANPLLSTINRMTYEGASTAKKTGGRRKSIACQTDPFGSSVNIPGLVESPVLKVDPRYAREINNDERNFFVYLVSDMSGNAFYKKDCVGRVMLPPKTTHLTLSQLRDKLIRSDDEELRALIRNNRHFRFVTETYKFVAKDETVAPIEDVFPTQGIYIKFTENPVLPDSLRGLSPTPPRRNIMPSFLNLNEEHRSGSKLSTTSPQPPYNTLNKKGIHGFTIEREIIVRQHMVLNITSIFVTITHAEKSDLDSQTRLDILHRRHIECVSPLPLKHKEAQRKFKRAHASLYREYLSLSSKLRTQLLNFDPIP